MRVLVLEDDPRRIRWLERMVPEADVFWTQSVPRLLRILQEEGVWDLVLLDHDLNRKYTGTDAAKTMSVVGPIIVWSRNPTGAKRMVRILEKRDQLVIGWFPFGSPGLVQRVRVIRDWWVS